VRIALNRNVATSHDTTGLQLSSFVSESAVGTIDLENVVIAATQADDTATGKCYGITGYDSNPYNMTAKGGQVLTSHAGGAGLAVDRSIGAPR
jgi:hypothetical protein